MTRGQRRAHRLAWVALFLLLPMVLVYAWGRREDRRATLLHGAGEAPR